MNRRTFLSFALAPLAQQITSRPRDYSNDMHLWLGRLMEQRRLERGKIVAAITTREQMQKRQQVVREKVWELLGGPLEKTPLNPRIVGSVPRDGYRIDKLIYESRPGLYVTSNIYVPAGRGAFPAVLSPLGHYNTGKTSPYQYLFHTLARKGYIVLAFDPFGQGERIEYPGSAPGISELGGPTREHDYAGKRLLLLGPNFGLYRAWDGVRGIDYLLSRDDVDPKRIACGGQSGGGTMTMYLAAIDERIHTAIVAEGNTENVAQPNFEGPGAVDDAEQNLAPSLVYGIDRFDLLHAFAPRPLLITVSNKDAGTTYGPQYITDAMALMEELKATYRLFGAEDHVQLAETPMRHGYSYEHRRASYAWYNRWLGRPGEDDREPPVVLEPDKNLWCTESGFVRELNGESSFTLIRKLSEATKPSAPVDRPVIRRALALPPEARGPEPDLLSTTEKYDSIIYELDIPSEGEIHVPAWVTSPSYVKQPLPAVLVLSDSGKEALADETGMGPEFARAGFIVCAVDVRGRGQCTPRPAQHGPRYYAGRGEDYWAFAALMVGRSLLGGYVQDALQALWVLRHWREADPARVSIIGRGTMGVVALLAMALDGQVRSGVVQDALSDYRLIVENERYSTPFRVYAQGLLKHFDLPDVAAAVAPRPLLMLNPVDQNGYSILPRTDAATRFSKLYASATIRAADPVTANTYIQWLTAPSRQ